MSDTKERVARRLREATVHEHCLGRSVTISPKLRDELLSLLSDPEPAGGGDWWCPGCRIALDGTRVTNDERCDTCGAPVSTTSPTNIERDHRAMRQAVAVLETADTALSYDDSYEGSDLEKRIVRTMQELDAILAGGESDE